MQRRSPTKDRNSIKRNFREGRSFMARILEVADYNELVYKLTLKYLRQKGYDIGYNKLPRVKA
jgi:hypothetical protein